MPEEIKKTEKSSNGDEPEMTTLNEQKKRPSLLAKVFGLTTNGNGEKPVPEETFFVTTDGAAVVDFEKLKDDDDFEDSASAVRDFAAKYTSKSGNGSKPKI